MSENTVTLNEIDELLKKRNNHWLSVEERGEYQDRLGNLGLVSDDSSTSAKEQFIKCNNDDSLDIDLINATDFQMFSIGEFPNIKKYFTFVWDLNQAYEYFTIKTPRKKQEQIRLTL